MKISVDNSRFAEKLAVQLATCAVRDAHKFSKSRLLTRINPLGKLHLHVLRIEREDRLRELQDPRRLVLGLEKAHLAFPRRRDTL